MRYTFDGDVADIVGVNAALLYGRIRFWCDDNKDKGNQQNYKDGKWWMFSTINEFVECYSFMSRKMVTKALQKLTEANLIEVGTFNSSVWDRTKWYSYNPISPNSTKGTNREVPKGTLTIVPKGTIEEPQRGQCHSDQRGQCINYKNQLEETIREEVKESETVAERSGETLPSSDSESSYNSLADSVIDELNSRTGSNYRHTKTSRKHIIARAKEGFTFDDFQYVINVKTNEWLNDPKMKQYLRPETLFGSKFENYLNQQPTAPKQKEEKLTAFEQVQMLRKARLENEKRNSGNSSRTADNDVLDCLFQIHPGTDERPD